MTLFNINCNAACLKTALFLFVGSAAIFILIIYLYKIKALFCRTNYVRDDSVMVKSSRCDNAVFL